ncbi:MAG: hypothetical protein HFACDABA_01135 [Anaerolineales bacterium]|nr:hypothetical protein [Anaerolineales bacterium]
MRGSLARTIIWALAALSFIPLTVMAATAYARARALLGDQIESQMQNLVSSQVATTEKQIKVRQIRLNRAIRQANFQNAMNAILRLDKDNPLYIESAQTIETIFFDLNREGAEPVFTKFIIFLPEGEVILGSDPGWVGINLKDNSLFETLRSASAQTIGLYDFSPFIRGEFAMLTVEQHRPLSGSSQATIVGISEQQTAISILEALGALAPETARAYFVTERGGFIGMESYTNTLEPFTTSIEQRTTVTEALDGLKNAPPETKLSTVYYPNESGEAVIAQVAWMEELQAGLILEIPQTSVFGQLNSLVPFTLLVYGGLALATILAALWITSRITRPLLSLTDATSRLAQGNLQERIDIHRNDEIGSLAASFNSMAGELSRLYASLREEVDERTRQIRTAAEVAQSLTSSFELNELLQRTAQLIVERFGFYHVGVFLLDETGKFATLRAAHGPASEEMLKRGHQHQVGSASIVGWVAANKTARVASSVEQDPMHYRNELLPLTQAEAGIPVILGGVALGVLDVQSVQPHTFDEEMLVVLQTLANQIAAAIQNTKSAEEEETRTLAGGDRFYRDLLTVAQSSTEPEAFEAAARVLREARNPFILLKAHENTFEIYSAANPFTEIPPELPHSVAIAPHEAQSQISGPLLIGDVARETNAPQQLTQLLRLNGSQSGLIAPVTAENRAIGLILVGEIPGQPFTSLNMRSFTALSDVLSIALARIGSLTTTRARMEEMGALMTLNRAVTSVGDAQSFYATLQEQVARVIGNYSFFVALYESKTNTIEIPYLYEDGKTTSIAPFPLGEGLTSILIRTRRPLMLVQDTERQAQALGAKIQGKAARSWLGVPLLVGEEPIGAIIIQDSEQEQRFSEHDLDFMVDVSKQVSGVIHNGRLLEQSRRTNLQLQTAAEIARDISGSLNLDELLLRAVNLIVERFHFYHASIFLVDLHGEYAVIREATGEAGAQLKRLGHKLGIGSKSIVGYVTGRGETLMVNDTLKDATYFANPILPDTRSECAIPLKVGERVLGALDVQSASPFAFTEESLRTLEILADQLAVAVVNTELFADSQEHLSQHRLLHHITTTAASGTTLEEALETTVKGLQVTLGGDRVSIMLADRERRRLEAKASIGYSEETSKTQISFDQGVTGWVATHRRPLRVDDVKIDPRYIEISSNTRSELALPLLYRNELLGVLNVESEQAAAYTENDEEMLGTLAGSLAAVIANARLLEQIRRQAERERVLYEVTSKIRRSTDVQSILATTASELLKAIGARGTQIRLKAQESSNPNGKGEE